MSSLMRQTHNWRGKIQSLMASHRLPLVQDCFLFICKWKSFHAFALPFTFQRGFHCHDCVWGPLAPFCELHGSFVLLLSILLYPAYRRTQGELVFFLFLYKLTPGAWGNLWGFLMTACLVSPRYHKEHFKVLGSKALTAKKMDAK